MRGSKYELKFDYAGKPVNEEEIRKVLRKKEKDEQMIMWVRNSGIHLRDDTDAI